MLRGFGNTNWKFTFAINKGRLVLTNLQLVIEKVERRFEGWQAKMLSEGERLVLL